MRVYVMPANCRSFEDIRLVERPDPVPGRGQVVGTGLVNGFRRPERLVRVVVAAQPVKNQAEVVQPASQRACSRGPVR